MSTGAAVFRSFVAVSAITLLANAASAQCGMYSSMRLLDFSAPTPGTILDRNGVGTGFDARLGGTGGAIVGNDPNLELDAAAGVLRVTSTASDLNNQVNLSNGVYPGFHLSSLGFTGTQDFCVSARFDNVQLENLVDQFGIYVGQSSARAVRAGALFTGESRLFNVWTNGGVDQGIVFGAFTGGSLDAQISRTGGVFSMFVNGIDLSSNLFGGDLNALDDLTVGIFAANPFNNVPKLGTLSEFRVGVGSTVVPEPTLAALVFLGLAITLAARSRHMARCVPERDRGHQDVR